MLVNFYSIPFIGFRESIRRNLPQKYVYCLSRFHPTDAVLACGSSDGQVTILKGANGSVPFFNWRIEREFKVQNVKGIWSIEWNVSYSNFTEFPMSFNFMVICSAFKLCNHKAQSHMGITIIKWLFI